MRAGTTAPHRDSGFARVALALAVGVFPSALAVHPALADHDDGGNRGRERGRLHGRDHEHRADHHRFRVYAPTRVYYPRDASRGISLFIPPNIR